MKIPVYDRVNKARLLGYYKNPPLLSGTMFKCVLRATVPGSDFRLGGFMASAKAIVFDIEVRSTSTSKEIDAFTREITTFERKVLETDEPLETLMKLSQFTVSGETDEQHAFREHSSGRRHGTSDFY
jgi:hypothetical protein